MQDKKMAKNRSLSFN